jgi:hypothetical protein
MSAERWLRWIWRGTSSWKSEPEIRKRSGRRDQDTQEIRTPRSRNSSGPNVGAEIRRHRDQDTQKSQRLEEIRTPKRSGHPRDQDTQKSQRLRARRGQASDRVFVLLRETCALPSKAWVSTIPVPFRCRLLPCSRKTKPAMPHISKSGQRSGHPEVATTPSPPRASFRPSFRSDPVDVCTAE